MAMHFMLFLRAFLDDYAGTVRRTNFQRQRSPTHGHGAKINLSRQRPETIGVFTPLVGIDSKIAHTVKDHALTVFLVALGNMRVVPVHNRRAGVDEGPTEF